MLYRKIQPYIESYLKSDSNKVLIIDGARQIGKTLNTTRVSNFFIGTRVVSYSESLALQGFPLFINNPDAS